MSEDISIARQLALEVATEALGLSEEAQFIGLLKESAAGWEATTQWEADMVTDAIEKAIADKLPEVFESLINLAEDLQS